MNMETVKKNIWNHVTVSEDSAELCLCNYQKLARKGNEIQRMVYAIVEVAAKLRNVKVFKWATYNDWYSEELARQYDVFLQVAENGHIKVLEWADIKDYHWYCPKMLFNAVARTNLELLYFLLNKKPHKFNLNFSRRGVTNGYIEVVEWWKQMELVELFTKALYSE
jgi:hypothetical protein